MQSIKELTHAVVPAPRTSLSGASPSHPNSPGTRGVDLTRQARPLARRVSTRVPGTSHRWAIGAWLSVGLVSFVGLEYALAPSLFR